MPHEFTKYDGFISLTLSHIFFALTYWQRLGELYFEFLPAITLVVNKHDGCNTQVSLYIGWLWLSIGITFDTADYFEEI